MACPFNKVLGVSHCHARWETHISHVILSCIQTRLLNVRELTPPLRAFEVKMYSWSLKHAVPTLDHRLTQHTSYLLQRINPVASFNKYVDSQLVRPYDGLRIMRAGGHAISLDSTSVPWGFTSCYVSLLGVGYRLLIGNSARLER